mmetsp:Transcript_28207/g.34851  ORF Transcript_28207/g.34851 Transcript_28207/m.34851 type:complete len:90 (-) Transcript_28207:3277-3546(-)
MNIQYSMMKLKFEMLIAPNFLYIFKNAKSRYDDVVLIQFLLSSLAYFERLQENHICDFPGATISLFLAGTDALASSSSNLIIPTSFRLS